VGKPRINLQLTGKILLKLASSSSCFVIRPLVFLIEMKGNGTQAPPIIRRTL